jgi:cytochrome c-type biogenesis protein CcmH/NrfG
MQPGIQALLRKTKIQSRQVRAEDIAFQIAPRINASGRLGSGGSALELLLTDDPTFHDPKDALARATTLAKIHPDNGRSHLHLALALLIAGDGASAATSIESARRHGGDPACCTALYALVAARRKDRDETGRLLEKLRSDLRQPNEERLRPRLLHRLRSLGLLRP